MAAPVRAPASRPPLRRAPTPTRTKMATPDCRENRRRHLYRVPSYSPTRLRRRVNDSSRRARPALAIANRCPLNALRFATDVADAVRDLDKAFNDRRISRLYAKARLIDANAGTTGESPAKSSNITWLAAVCKAPTPYH